MSRFDRRLVLFFVLIGIVAAALVALPAVMAEGEGVTAATTVEMWLRAGPAQDYNGILLMPPGVTVPVVGRSVGGDWLLLDYQGQRGWGAAWLLTTNGDVSSAPVTGEIILTIVTKYDVNLRAGPGADYPDIGSVKAGTTLIPLARNVDTSWLLTRHRGTQGWVAAWLVTPYGDLTSLTVVDDSGATIPTPTPIPTPAPPTGTFFSFDTPVVRETFALGQTLGRRANALSKVGDSETVNPYFLIPYTGAYHLGPYAYLQGTIDWFRPSGSFERASKAAIPGMFSWNVVDPKWADKSKCGSNESPLACEYREHNPALALILVRTFTEQTAEPGGQYEQGLREIIEYSLEQGVIPVLTTVPRQIPEHVSERILNDIVRALAAEYQVPLWDLWVTTEQLPNYGIDFQGTNANHLTIPPDGNTVDFRDDHMNFGKTRRNLEAMEILYLLLHGVILS